MFTFVKEDHEGVEGDDFTIHYKLIYLVFVPSCLRWFFLQGKDKTPEERRIAICIFDDVAEQCREAALKYVWMP